MRNKRENIFVNGHKYTILRSYGHRKDGYLYLVVCNEELYMLKEYTEDVLPNVLASYEKLKKLGIRMPKCIEWDTGKRIIVKECIDGKSAYALLQECELDETYLDQLRNMAAMVEKENLCLDYFPTQFVCEEKELYYAHYGCEEKKEENLFSNCVKKYWIDKKGLF